MHIDHGEPTLADGLQEESKSVEMRMMQAHVSDSIDIEREQGITIHTDLRPKRIQGQGWRDVLVEPDGYSQIPPGM